MCSFPHSPFRSAGSMALSPSHKTPTTSTHPSTSSALSLLLILHLSYTTSSFVTLSLLLSYLPVVFSVIPLIISFPSLHHGRVVEAGQAGGGYADQR